MTRRGSPRIEGYAALAATGLVAALAVRRPELAVLAAPFALLLAAGTRIARDPKVSVELDVETERLLEGEEIDAAVTLRAESAVDRLEVLLALPPGVETVEGKTAWAVRLRRDTPREIPLRLRCSRWGLYDVGEFEVRARDPFRLVVWEQHARHLRRLKTYPREETLRRILSPVETQAFTGSEVARVKGDGIEYADLREYVPGDRLRSINWRASARTGGLVVNERHPERNTDVVLFVDSFYEVRGPDGGTLDDAVRAAATLATRYLARRDRVGMVGFGGLLHWIEPSLGPAQRYRLIETLLETGVQPTYTWRAVNVLPARILPTKALVIGLTPLADERFIVALEDLRARGFDVAVVEVDPVRLVEPGPSEAERLAFRLWILEREVLRSRLAGLGIGVGLWGDDVELEAVLEGVRTYRRSVRLARV
ncbi:MAG TPA: DUF58 domain-containing protein [Gaiellaceae bacterium]|nr:DUF58 domain-containing protein [Gaiellaceae bacterium]